MCVCVWCVWRTLLYSLGTTILRERIVLIKRFADGKTSPLRKEKKKNIKKVEFYRSK